MVLTEKQSGLLAALSAAGVEYAVVGGLAVIFHGYLRTTHDLDVFFRPSVENAEAAYRALQTLGINLRGMDAMDLLNDSDNLRLGPREDSVDMLSRIGEMTFDQVWRNRVEVTIDDLPVVFISKADLIENKRQVGRLRDLADVEELLLIQDAT